MSSVFYLTAIIFIVVSPLVVPAAVSILHTVRGLRGRAAAARPALPAFALAMAGALPAAV